jgi:nucleoside-diphosphate-sugar epimerase
MQFARQTAGEGDRSVSGNSYLVDRRFGTQPEEGERVTDLNVVLGAGPVGRALVERLVAENRPTRVVTRSGTAQVPSGVEVVAADVTEADEAERACDGAGVVFGCVGLPGYERWPEMWPPLMEGMLRGAEASGATLIFLDNLYMYGPVDGPRREDMALTNYGSKPAVRAEITRMWQAAHNDGRLRAAAVRASDFYGPGVTLAALGEASFGRLSGGKSAQTFGDPDQPHSFTYVNDVARALVSVAEGGEDVLGQSWHVPNAPDRTVRQLLIAFAEELGVKPKIQTLPAWAMGPLGLINPTVRESREMLYQWDRPFQVDHSKFAGRFWDDPTPFEVGIPATADWYRSR